MAAARDGDDIHSFLSASGVRLQRPSPRRSGEEFSNSHASYHRHHLLATVDVMITRRPGDSGTVTSVTTDH